MFPDTPYERLEEASTFAASLLAREGLTVCSMQSIWFGRTEHLFGSREERKQLSDYTKKAIDFAAAIGCRNLVFGSPKNRVISSPEQIPEAISFFREVGGYASQRGRVVAIEPNPSLYGTNFINTTQEAFSMVKEVDSPGVMVNVDFGTILANREGLEAIEENLPLISHIHISEPNLVAIQQREEHRHLAEILRKHGYTGFISIEMKNTGTLDEIIDAISYVKGVFQ